MDALTRDILTQIQGGQSAFAPCDATHNSVVEFQATAKRIEWARKRGFIHDAKYVLGKSGELHAIPVQVAIVGGLTLEGEQELLEDPDERAF